MGKGVSCETLDVTMGAISKASVLAKMRLVANRLSAIGQYRRLFRKQKIRAVYVNSSYQVAPMIAAWMERLPLFVHVREGASTGRTHGLKRWMVRHMAQTAAFDARAGLEIFGPPLKGQTWEVSPNGVKRELSKLRVSRERLRESLGFEPDHTIILFLGTLCERKGLHDLLEVWPRLYKKFPQARLIVAGGTDPSETNPLIRDFPERPPEGTEYLGFRNDASELIAAADFLVLPSYAEAMPITISEAMMIGTPVIARDVGDVSFQIGGDRGFLFHGKGPDVVYTAISEALESLEEASEKARQSREFAERNLDQREQYRQIRRLILEAIRIKKRRRS